RRTVIEPIPRFPAIERDVALVVPAVVSAADVDHAFEAIRSAAPLLRQFRLFDLYAGEQVGAGRQSLAYSLLYQAEGRTLTDSAVNAVHQEVGERLRQSLGAEVRGAVRS